MLAKAFEREEIIHAVKDGRCKRPPHVEMAGKDYYADRMGNVYSLNGEVPKQIEAKTGWGGFQWVVLATSEGWHRYHVGELMAETYLADQKPKDGEHTVKYKNGNTKDNRVENLMWITKLEASALRQSSMVQSAPGKKSGSFDELMGLGTDYESGAGETGKETSKNPKDEDVRTLIERNRTTQNRLEDLQNDYTLVLEALRAFAEHKLSAELRLGHPDTPVIESNKGKADHGVITVADFRRAEETLETIERKHHEKTKK